MPDLVASCKTIETQVLNISLGFQSLTMHGLTTEKIEEADQVCQKESSGRGPGRGSTIVESSEILLANIKQAFHL